MSEDIIERAVGFVKELFRTNAGGHDAEHTLRVFRNAALIAGREAEQGRGAGCDREVVLLAALLHDADDYKLFQTENNANARAFLTQNGVSEERIEQICEAVNSVSFSKNRGRVPATPEGRIVQDADRLDAIGAVGIARTFAFGGEHGRGMDESIRHFYDKLLLLKDLMNTETAKEIAATRHAFMQAYLDEYYAETCDDGAADRK